MLHLRNTFFVLFFNFCAKIENNLPSAHTEYKNETRLLAGSTKAIKLKNYTETAMKHLCVFRPAFGCCAHTKAGRKNFWGCFRPFLFISNVFKNSYFNYYLKMVHMQTHGNQHPKAGQNTQQIYIFTDYMKIVTRFFSVLC